MLSTLFVLWTLFPFEIPKPGYERNAETGLTIQLPAEILQEEEVHEKLFSGLTNSFRISANFKARTGGSYRSLILIECRYALWDEEFLVRIHESERGSREIKVSSFEEFRSWWKRADFLLVNPAGLDKVPRSIKLSMAFIPFSQTEGIETRKWFVDASKPTQVSTRDAVGNSAFFDALMATSIRRVALLEYHWRLQFEP